MDNLYVGCKVRWKRQEYSAYHMMILLDLVEQGFTGPFNVDEIQNQADCTVCGVDCYQHISVSMCNDPGKKINEMMSSWWFEICGG